MRKWLLILYASFLLAGCKSKSHIPANVLPQLKMQAVLWDMIRADQFLTDFVLNKDSTLNKKTESIKLYLQVFNIHHISKEEFQHSFSFYRSHPALLKVIMDSLSTISSTSLAELYKPKPLTDTLHPDTNKLQQRKDTMLFRKRKRIPRY
jgi:Domain of unknown function (DUF4296)